MLISYGELDPQQLAWGLTQLYGQLDYPYEMASLLFVYAAI
jgi:hypothetical protein